MRDARAKVAMGGALIGLIALIAWLARRPQVRVDTPSAPSAVANAGRAKIEVPWGRGGGALGKKNPPEGNPEAPMSLVVDADGVTWVLDQVNGRIVRYDKAGKALDTIPISLRGAQDLALTPDGNVVVLDRLADKQLAIIGPDGKVRGTLSLEGKNLKEGGAATGVFVDGDKVYVERAHQSLVKVGDTKGNADPDREELPGRPTRDGQGYIRAWLDEGYPKVRAFVTFANKESKVRRFTRALNLPFSAKALALLDTDRAGIIYVGVVAENDPTVTVYCLDPTHGVAIGQTTVPANTGAEETFRDFAVLDSGGAVYMQRTEQGVSVIPIDCRAQ